MIATKSNMYKDAKTQNYFVGCRFDCVYCKPSFQAQMKRQKHNCMDCYRYKPHEHPERLGKIPNSKIVFVCGDGDISFSTPEYTNKIIETIKKKSKPNQTVYFQSKNPAYFSNFDFPSNVVLLTTLETDDDEIYRGISKAPTVSVRAEAFRQLEHPRKGITIEPIIKFNTDRFVSIIKGIKPEFVWIGYNSRPKQVQLPEPLLLRTKELIAELEKFTEVRRKTIRMAWYGEGIGG